MKGVVGWIVKGAAAVVVLLVVAVGGLFAITNSKMSKDWSDVPVEVLSIPDDSASVAWGRHLVESRGCMDCHGEDLGGSLFMDAGPVGQFYGTNLTSGDGGVAGNYGDQDWVRAIRHGVGHDGKPLRFMPSYEYYYYSDRDVSALVAYLKTLPPVDRVSPGTQVGPVGRALYMAGQFPLLPVEMVNHTAPRPEPEPGVTPEYGSYLAVGCTGCHNPALSGGPMVGGDPSWPPASNLTPHPDGMAGWTEEQFFLLLKEGVRPDGRQVKAPMPISATSRMLDEEIAALWAYLQTLEPLATGEGADW